MGRIIFIYGLLFLSLTQSAFANDSTLHLIKEKTITGNYTDFYTDNFGNVFLISTNNQVKKLNQSLDSTAVFNDVRRYGDVYLLDVNNPLKIVVYYRDFTTILVLDRFLNVQNTIDLRNAGILQAKAVSQSYDNNYWIFDELSSKIKKIDDNGNVLLESADFRVLFNYTYNPQYIIDNDGALYLYDNKKGWLIFDYYGAYKKHIDVLNLKDVRAEKNVLTGRDSSLFYMENINTFNEIKFSTDASFLYAVKIQVQMNKMYVLEKDQLTVYRIQ